jgi:hypothetical protein
VSQSGVWLAPNGLALGEEADFEALNYLPSTKFDTRHNVQLTTEPAFCQTPVSSSPFHILFFTV